MKKVILGNGEKYAVDNSYHGRPPGDIPNPYPIELAKRRITEKLSNTLASLENFPIETMPDNEIVTKLTLHPSFLAKSYYPSRLLNEYSLEPLGSKEVFVKPDVAVNNEQKERAVSSSVYYVSGKKISFERLLKDIREDRIKDETGIELGRIEELSLVNHTDKLINLNKDTNESGTFEIVLHTAINETSKIKKFIDFIKILDGEIDQSKIRTVDGLSFCFVKINNNRIAELAKFMFVRVVRPVPKINLSTLFSDDAYTLSENKPYLYALSQSNSLDDSNVAIFDGGLISEKINTPYLRYFDLTGSNDADSNIYSHGELVTSAVMYGQISELSSKNHETVPVDHYKVFCEADDEDIALVNVLDRICSILSQKRYKIANISLGPSVPRPDDEPSLWTSTLDKLAEDGSALIIIAAGNSGSILEICPDDEDLARIQPPADMLNGMSIGAANSAEEDWKRANYSSIGPGRRPGYVKPDAVFFGGEEEPCGEKIRLIGLYDYEEKHKHGTSYAAPLVTRLAARLDRKTFGTLTPATLRALLIHSADNLGDKKGCGWGRITDNIEEIIYCDEDRVTIIYQGELKKSSGVRAAIPCPTALLNTKTKVELNATLCFFTDIDHKHPVSYSKAGIEIVFRPHNDKFSINKETGEQSLEAKSRTLFNKANILGNEQTLRKDLFKWETCYKVNDSFLTSSIKYPTLDIKYLTRNEGRPLSQKEMKELKPLSYSLVITLSSNKKCNLYEEVVNEYDLLEPISLDIEQNITI